MGRIDFSTKSPYCVNSPATPTSPFISLHAICVCTLPPLASSDTYLPRGKMREENIKIRDVGFKWLWGIFKTPSTFSNWKYAGYFSKLLWLSRTELLVIYSDLDETFYFTLGEFQCPRQYVPKKRAVITRFHLFLSRTFTTNIRRSDLAAKKKCTNSFFTFYFTALLKCTRHITEILFVKVLKLPNQVKRKDLLRITEHISMFWHSLYICSIFNGFRMYKNLSRKKQFQLRGPDSCYTTQWQMHQKKKEKCKVEQYLSCWNACFAMPPSRCAAVVPIPYAQVTAVWHSFIYS